MNKTLINGDMLVELDKLEENSIDAIVTDPPYELNFMNKGWDNSGISYRKETWKKCLRVLKPGGYLLAFAAPRTQHRIACAIEDAGFEIRDTIMYIFGSGFPKNMDISKQFTKRCDENMDKLWSGFGTQLKPSYEPIIMARKPIEGTVADNVIKYGVGGINIDECRVPFENTPNPATNPLYRQEHGYKHDRSKSVAENSVTRFNTSASDKPISPLGRFPANIILTYEDSDYDEVCGGFPETSSNKSEYNFDKSQSGHIYGFANGGNIKSGVHYEDSGSACRYFYCAKASKRDRNEGLSIGKNTHPTVKPVSLMQYLVRLVSPKGSVILDPFMGSGSTGKGVAYENNDRNANYSFIGIELQTEYFEIAKQRIDFAEGDNIPLEEPEKETKDPSIKDDSIKRKRLF